MEPGGVEPWPSRGRLGKAHTITRTFQCCESHSLEENTFSQGKKIKPYCRHSDQIACPLVVGEQGPGEGQKPMSSGQEGLKAIQVSKGKKAQSSQRLEVTSLQAEAKPEPSRGGGGCRAQRCPPNLMTEDSVYKRQSSSAESKYNHLLRTFIRALRKETT